MAEGLAGRPSSLKMLPSFVTRRCNGKETGRYIALDLGGTNFRAVLVTLHGNGRFTSVQKKFVVSPAYQTGDGEQARIIFPLFCRFINTLLYCFF